MPIRWSQAVSTHTREASLWSVARPAPTVLGVDDQPLNLELLGAYLEGVGCTFVTAADGESALEAVERWRPDLVLLDVVMPGLDGLEVCRRIKSNPAHRFLPVVLVTSLSSVADRVRGLEAGADDILTKPVDRSELLARVVTLIETKEVYDRLDDAEHVMAAFARMVEAKDSGTEAHIERVARSARALGEAAGLSGPDLAVVYFGGMVHDVGKVGIADAVLLKPGPLTDEDIAEMRRHVAVGVEIAGGLKSAAAVVPIIKHHHERFDGSGYPDGLVGDDIPAVAMIVAICDAYDAMTSNRPYRMAMSVDEAIAELVSGAGSQWNPDLVALFLSAVLRAAPGGRGLTGPAASARGDNQIRGGR